MANQTLNLPRETTHERIADALEGIETSSSNNPTSANMQAIITALNGIAGNIVNTNSADNINYDNTTSGLSAVKVQGAIDELESEKVDKIAGKGLSTEDYSTAEKTKLAGIEERAQKNITFYGTCSTDSDVKEKVVVCEDFTSDDLVEGISIRVLFYEGNEISNPKMDVNSTGEKAIERTYEINSKYNWSNGVILTFTYSGKSWILNDHTQYFEGDGILIDPNTNTVSNRGVLSLAEGTTNGTISVTNKNETKDVRLHGYYTIPYNIAEADNQWDMDAYGVEIWRRGYGTPPSTVYTDERDEMFPEGINQNDYYVNLINGDVYELIAIRPIAGGKRAASSYVWDKVYTLPRKLDQISEQIEGSKTSSGSIVTIDDAANVNAESVIVDIKPVQAGSGDPSPDNIRPITGQTEVVIEDCGKNLCPINNVNGTLYQNIRCYLPQGTYTISAEATSTDTDTNICIAVLSDVNADTIQQLNFSRGRRGYNVFTTTKDVYSINFYASNSYAHSINDTFAFNDIQIELGTTASDFEPYKGKTYTIQLGDTIYGGELDVLTGELTVDRGIATLNGSEANWYYSSSYGGYAYNTGTAIIMPNFKANTTVISDKLKAGTVSELTDVSKTNLVCLTNVICVKLDSSYDTVDKYLAWLSSNNSQVCYELAEPYTIQLTPQQIRLLKGTNNIYANSGDLSIKYQPDNVLGDLLAEAEVGYDKQIEYIKTSLIPSRTRNDITDRLQMLPQAVAEQNLEKYGYKIGDYFQGIESTPYTYHLSDYNTFKGTSTPYCITSNHLGIVVDTHTTSQWHTGDASNVGYNGSTLHTYLKGTVMDNIKADMIALFGGSTGLEHLLAHSKLLTTALANLGWQAGQYISALSEVQTIGSRVWSVNGYQTGEAAKKLEIFNKYKWTEIFEGRYPWLRDMQSASHACHLDNFGYAGFYSVTNAYYVVGLINFY